MVFNQERMEPAAVVVLEELVFMERTFNPVMVVTE